MKTANLLKAFAKNGIEVKRIERQCRWGVSVDYIARTAKNIGTWTEQVPTGETEKGEFRTVYIHGIDQHDDLMSDYFCGSFADSIKQAVAWMLD